jgi:iron complex outermembrane recepter protein
VPALAAGALLLVAAVARAGRAQQPIRDSVPHQLETLTVTARPAGTLPPVELSTEVPARVVERQQSANAYDLIRRAAGIEVHEQGQGPGWASDVVIRGFTSDHSSDVLLVLDGVPINLPIHGHVEGYSDWTILSPAALDGVRVVHGPVSPLHGNFALGGAVEVTSAVDATGSAASVGGSSYGDAGGWVRTGHRGGGGGYVAALQGERGEGWRHNSGSALGNLQLHGWRQLGDRTRVEGGVMGYGAQWDSPGFITVGDYNAGRLRQAVDGTDGGSGGRVVLQGRVRRELTEGRNLDLVGWVQGARSSVFLTVPDGGVARQQQERDRRAAVGVNGVWRAPTAAGEFSIGVGGRADWDRYDLYRTDRRDPVLTRQLTEGRYQDGHAYLRTRGLTLGRLQYDLALRGDVLRYVARDRVVPGATSRSSIQAVLTPKLGTRVLLGGGVSMVGSVSRGFRGPIGVIDNPRQPLVTAWAQEIGVQLLGARISAQLSAFQTDVRNEKILDPVTLEVSDAGSSRRRGLSAELGWAVTTRIRVVAEGTFNDARLRGSAPGGGPLPLRALHDSVIGFPIPPLAHHVEPLAPGSTVPGVARWLGRVGVDLAVTPRLEGRALVRFSGPFTPIGEPGVRTRPYAVLDLGGSFRLSQAATLDVEVQNLLDGRYPEIRASGYLNPGAPRALRAALRLAALSL